ncbi:YncE family protein [Bizionia sp.]|uniref:YncE family protein n=1 Tax=Bizionia sp. TaxID=1954480 RepID=UPI003A8EA7FB
MKHVIKFLTFSLLFAFVFTSCSSDDDNFSEPQVSLGDYENGILVSAEGGPSSVSYISNDFSTIENNIFFNVNEEDLGNYLQSVGFNGNQAYIISDNVNTINVVDRYSFNKKSSITAGLYTPRYIGFANGKGYVTNWGDGNDADDDFIAVINLSTNTVESTIPVGEGPEQIIANGNTLYISHKGGYGVNNIITVLNTNNNLISTITVNDVPDEMLINDEGNLVVLSEGANQYWLSPPNITQGSIATINMTDNTIMDLHVFEVGNHPSQMSYGNGTIYYVLNNEIYEMADAATSLPTTSLINLGAITTYGMAVKNEHIYITDAKDFASLGDLLVYELSSGNLIHTFEVGVNASKIYFN